MNQSKIGRDCYDNKCNKSEKCNTFEEISELDSYFIHKHKIIKYRSSLI